MNARHLLIAILALFATTAQAQEFDKYFTDRTLRLNYIFGGNATEQHVYLDNMDALPRWYGKRKRLAEVPVEGNAQIIVRSHDSQETIYRNSFSTLFQEWQVYDEAKSNNKSFENVLLVPMPKDTVDITVELYDHHRKVSHRYTHTVTPTDILIRHKGDKLQAPYVTLQQAADTTRCIHIAFLAEGYTKDELDLFVDDARTAMEGIFEYEPFKQYRDRFNIVAVKSPSEDSGTSEPGQGIWKNTALRSSFDTFYSDRYLTTLRLETVHDWLAGTPYEHIIIMVNTPKYGGGGILNSYNLTMTRHRLFKTITVHEFGHSFAGLADEYATDDIPMYPSDTEPWEPNITTLHDFHGKWESLIKPGTPIPTPESKDPKTIANRVGVYEGAGYSLKGVYRPLQDCRMRTNEHPEFCVVCRNAIANLIKFYTE